MYSERVIADLAHNPLVQLPQVVLDNSDGKVSAFIETWTWGSAITREAAGVHDAAAVARSLLAGGVA